MRNMVVEKFGYSESMDGYPVLQFRCKPSKAYKKFFYKLVLTYCFTIYGMFRFPKVFESNIYLMKFKYNSCFLRVWLQTNFMKLM